MEDLKTSTAILRLVDFTNYNNVNINPELKTTYLQNKHNTLLFMATDILKNNNNNHKLANALTIPPIYNITDSDKQQKINTLLELKISNTDEEIINNYLDFYNNDYQYDFKEFKQNNFFEEYYKVLLFKIYNVWYNTGDHYFDDIQKLCQLINDNKNNIFTWNNDFGANRSNIFMIINKDDIVSKNVIKYLEKLNRKYINNKIIINEKDFLFKMMLKYQKNYTKNELMKICKIYGIFADINCNKKKLCNVITKYFDKKKQ